MRTQKQSPEPKSPWKVTKVAIEEPEKAETFNRVLIATIKALEDSGVRYAFIGGIASGGMGRPRSTHDIDVFLMPDDAEIALRSLQKHGFRIERTDPSWLYKGFKDGVLVDVIFKSKGDIYLDAEMYQRLITLPFHGTQVKMVAPEDLLIIKSAAHSELTPGHWHDAIGLLSHASFDWDYLIQRARRAPRRVLSLLLYAQSCDVWVPNHVVQALFDGLFGDTRTTRSARIEAPSKTLRNFMPSGAPQPPAPTKHFEAYVVPHLRECLASDVRTHELDIQIDQQDHKILLRGDVTSEERRDAITTITRECYPQLEIVNQLRVLTVTEPDSEEEVK